MLLVRLLTALGAWSSYILTRNVADHLAEVNPSYNILITSQDTYANTY